MNRSRLLQIGLALLVVGSFVAIGVIWLRGPFYETLQRALTMNPIWILVIAGLYFAARYANGETLYWFFRRTGQPVGRWPIFAMLMVKSYTNLLLPKGGIGTSAVFLRAAYGVKITDLGAAMMAMLLLQTCAMGVIGMLTLVVLYLIDHAPFQPLVFALFAFCAIGGFAATQIRLPTVSHQETDGDAPRTLRTRLLRIFNRANDAWRMMTADPRVLPLLALPQVVAIVLRWVRMLVAFYALGYEQVDPIGVLLGSLLGDIAIMISIAPMGLGFREAAVAWPASLIGVSPDAVVAVTLIDRACWSVAVLILGQAILWFSRKRLFDKEADEAS